MISANLKRAANQIRNFKQVAVDQTGEDARLIIMSEVLSDFHNSMKNELKRSKISLSINCPEDIVLTHFPGDIWRILANLLFNSLEHGYSDGRRGTIEISVESDEKTLIIEFSDDGRGISEDIVDRVFKPYYTTTREKGGSGLGLHLVQSIVKDRHGGSITVSNRLPHGARFLIKLPVNSPAVTEN